MAVVVVVVVIVLLPSLATLLLLSLPLLLLWFLLLLLADKAPGRIPFAGEPACLQVIRFELGCRCSESMTCFKE